MSVETDAQKDIRALIVAALPNVAVYDRHAEHSDDTPYITFGPTQRVRNHYQATRNSIYYMTMHLWVRDNEGSVASRDLANQLVDAIDNRKLSTANLDCYYVDHTSLYEQDEVMNHIVIQVEVR